MVDALNEDVRAACPAMDTRPGPDELRTLIEVAQSFERANQWHEAELAWREVLNVTDDFWLPYMALAQIFKNTGRRDDLLKAIESAEGLIPIDNASALARLSELAGDWAAAVERWRLAISMSPDDWHHYVSLSRSYEQLSKIPECFEILWRAEVRFIGEINIVSELAQVAQRHGRWAEAER